MVNPYANPMSTEVINEKTYLLAKDLLEIDSKADKVLNEYIATHEKLKELWVQLAPMWNKFIDQDFESYEDFKTSLKEYTQLYSLFEDVRKLSDSNNKLWDKKLDKLVPKLIKEKNKIPTNEITEISQFDPDTLNRTNKAMNACTHNNQDFFLTPTIVKEADRIIKCLEIGIRNPPKGFNVELGKKTIQMIQKGKSDFTVKTKEKKTQAADIKKKMGMTPTQLKLIESLLQESPIYIKAKLGNIFREDKYKKLKENAKLYEEKYPIVTGKPLPESAKIKLDTIVHYCDYYIQELDNFRNMFR